MEEETQQARPTANITIGYDPVAQQVTTLQMDPAQYRNPEFALSVLKMAQRFLESQIAIHQMQAMQQQAMAQAQTAAIGKVLNGRFRG